MDFYLLRQNKYFVSALSFEEKKERGKNSLTLLRAVSLTSILMSKILKTSESSATPANSSMFNPSKTPPRKRGFYYLKLKYKKAEDIFIFGFALLTNWPIWNTACIS
jgi:hypothetical protein